MKNNILLISSFVLMLNGFVQHSNLYMPKEIKQAYEKGTRSWDGMPGSNYWINESDYEIDAEFFPSKLLIEGQIKITYQNNSPDTLTYIVVKLKQNMYQNGAARDHQIAIENITMGTEMRNVAIYRNGRPFSHPKRSVSNGTIHIVSLHMEDYIMPNTSITIGMNWKLKMPEILQSRTGKANDSTYFIGYWFPQIAVYDDIMGWDTDGYTGITETYNDLNNYSVNIKVPGNYFLWATGKLQNPEDVYSESFIQKMNVSKTSDEVIHLVSKEDLKNGGLLISSAFHEWTFQADQVPDFSFAVSNHYLWDATSALTDKKTGQRTWVSMVYPSKQINYDLGAKVAKESIEYFSEISPGIPFPYDKHISVFGEFASGMEFPMMANDGDMGEDISDFYDLVAHEIAHTYFPFYVNTNEKLYSWMDESWTTLFGTTFLDDKDMSPPPFFVWLDNLSWNSFRDLPPMIPTKNINQMEFMHQSYVRPKYSNIFLLEMFNEKDKDLPIKAYIDRWQGKHPTPYDFFFTMNDLFGEDLSWFWKPWYFDFCSPDLAISNVNLNNESLIIEISNPGQMPVPIRITVHYMDGTIDEFYKSAYAWKENPETHEFSMKLNGDVKMIVLGKERIPDIDGSNNKWKP